MEGSPTFYIVVTAILDLVRQQCILDTPFMAFREAISLCLSHVQNESPDNDHGHIRMRVRHTKILLILPGKKFFFFLIVDEKSFDQVSW